MIRRLVHAAGAVLQQYGLQYRVYLCFGYLVPCLTYYLYAHVPRRRLRRCATGFLVAFCLCPLWIVARTSRYAVALLGATLLVAAALWTARRPVRRWQEAVKAREMTRAARLARGTAGFVAWRDFPVDAAMRAAVDAQHVSETVLARLDLDGRALSPFGVLPYLPPVSAREFLERPRYQIDIVLRDGIVLLRKDYGRDRDSFVREWHNLGRLQGRANVPAIWKADERARLLYMSFIPGQTVREMLVSHGAKLRDCQTSKDPELAALGAEERRAAVAQRGAAIIHSVLPDSFVRALAQQIDAIHRAGLAGLGLKYGNVIVSAVDGSPWLVDFETPTCYGSRQAPGFWLRRDRDRVRFNELFQWDLMTEAAARKALSVYARNPEVACAPIDFGLGLSVGSVWATETGVGCWERLIRRHMPPLRNLRILDLGSNNGCMAMMMLRAGAREVIGVEPSLEKCEFARLAHRIFEWRDIRPYSFRLLNCNMLDVLKGDWGTFDLVSALCSLDCLTEEEMARVVRRASSLAPVMVLQGNTVAPRARAKSSASFLAAVLQHNGFPQVEIATLPAFSRSLLIGRKRNGGSS